MGVATSAADCRVLVVDDDPAIRRMVRAALDLEGYAVLTAAHGGEALELVAAHHPDVVLLDMQMPLVDGREFARRLQERDLHPLLVTMTADPGGRSWAGQIGAAAHLAKPFDLARLLAVVATCCAAAYARCRRRPPRPT